MHLFMKFILAPVLFVLSVFVIIQTYRKYKERFKEKDYLDKYDYSGMIITNGLTKTLSYQLINNAILLFKNNTKFLSLI